MARTASPPTRRPELRCGWRRRLERDLLRLAAQPLEPGARLGDIRLELSVGVAPPGRDVAPEVTVTHLPSHATQRVGAPRHVPNRGRVSPCSPPTERGSHPWIVRAAPPSEDDRDGISGGGPNQRQLG